MSQWKCAELDLATGLLELPQPLEALAAGQIPAIILRQAYPQDCCAGLVRKLIADEHLYDPTGPVPEKFLKRSIPEGYYRTGGSGAAEAGWRDTGETEKRRIDIGTSLGYRGHDREQFFAHAQETHRLFEHLFADFPSPVRLIYDSLTRLAPGKRAVTAYEPDGRRYGPAIIRAHYGGYTYQPHIDSVRFREQRSDYAIYALDHQFAGVLVLQNTEREGDTAQAILHRCLWQPEIDPHLRAGTFYQYAAEKGIEKLRICLEPGDLYYFNTRTVHEVPGLAGRLPRIVLATFIGYSSDRDEIFVWS